MLDELVEKQAKIVFNVLKDSTSQSVVKDFLKEKGVPVSAANWDALYSDRILPALKDKKIKFEDLANLLREVEEHGRQHIFLYKCDPLEVPKLLNSNRVKAVAQELGIQNLLTQPLYVEMPDEPKIVDIRLAEAPNGSGPLSLTIKVCECRETSKLIGDDYVEGTNKRIKTYEVHKKRAISIIKLTSDGMLEVRVASRDNSTKYNEQISEVVSLTNKFFLTSLFNAISLSSAKDKLFAQKDEFKDIIRYSTTFAKNDTGNTLTLAAGDLEKSLLADDGSSLAMKSFLANKGFVTGSNVWFIMPEDKDRQIHVILNGEINEFAVTGACTPREYSYVFGKILSLN